MQAVEVEQTLWSLTFTFIAFISWSAATTLNLYIYV